MFCRRKSFSQTARLGLENIELILSHFAPDGYRMGSKYRTLNPAWYRKRWVSLYINIKTGHWHDVVTKDKGPDVISYVAYLTGRSQSGAKVAIEKLLAIYEDAES